MANTNPSAPPVEEKTAMTNPFVGKDFSGFEDPKVTVAKRREKEKRAGAAADKPSAEAADAVYNKGANYGPLKPGENIWDPSFSSIRRNNIIGGWVAKSMG